MSQVSVTINGRQFRMACEDGQEGHLMNLARDLDVRIEGLRKKFGCTAYITSSNSERSEIVRWPSAWAFFASASASAVSVSVSRAANEL